MVFLNSGVHVVMYAYYLLTALYPRRRFWWKKYLTSIQLVHPPHILGLTDPTHPPAQAQFAFALGFLVWMVVKGCPIPAIVYGTFAFLVASFLALFLNFWLHAYVKTVPLCPPQAL